MHPGTVDASAGLLVQFLGWVAGQPRTYAETMEAWRTSCPRISVWEDALIEGLVMTENVFSGPQGEVKVVLTKSGMDLLGQPPPRPMPLVTSRQRTSC